MAAYIKKEFDSKHNPTWHCIVGRNFGAHRAAASVWPLVERGSLSTVTSRLPHSAGSYVTHETKHFIYFYLGPVAVLLFKSG